MAIKSPYFNSVRYWEYRIWRNNIFLQSSSERKKKKSESEASSQIGTFEIRYPPEKPTQKNQPEKNLTRERERFDWIWSLKKKKEEEDLEEDLK